MRHTLLKYLARRRWAHIRACYAYGRAHCAPVGWLGRRLNYDRLFREHMRIARILHAHDHNLYP